MLKRILALALAGLMACTSLGGCQLRRKETDVMKNTQTEKTEELEDGSFYIFHDGKYSKLFQNYATFDTAENPELKNSSYCLWYNEDEYALIPTFYEGDKLIFYTTTALNDEFTFDRYADMGWTFGVANLQASPSGRYYFYTTPQSGDSVNSLYPLSSMGREFQQYAGYKLFIDTIQGVPLKSGNISEGGTVLGLKKNESYTTEIYAGSKLHESTQQADTFTVSFMASYKVADMDFLQSTILEVHIPEWFQPGYYNVNGKGLFRYVKGDSYDEHTANFNVPNDDPSTMEDDPDEYEKMGEEEGNGDSAEAEVTVEEKGETEIYLSFGELPEGQAPVGSFYPDARIVVGEEEFSFEQYSDTELVYKADMEPGTYKVSITNLAGREYKLEVR